MKKLSLFCMVMLIVGLFLKNAVFAYNLLESGEPFDTWLDSRTYAAVAVDVPQDADKLTVTIRNGTGNLILYLKFGNPVSGNTLAELNANADIFSDGPSSDKTIILTPSTTTPLRPGMWYVTTLNLNDQRTHFTLTATVEREQILSPPGTDHGSGQESRRFSFNVTKHTVNDFFPPADFNMGPSQLKRSYDPFGMGLDWFKYSTIRSGRGGLRVEDLKIDDTLYWFDMQIDLFDPFLPLIFMNFQPGEPQYPYPAWYYDNDFVDFRMSKADVFGPPAKFSIYDVGIDGVAYDLDFTFDGIDFIFSDFFPSGYLHYIPDTDTPQVGIVSDSSQSPVLLESDRLCFADVPFGAPMAIFNVEGLEGQDYLEINYCSKTVVQKFDINNGIALGIYAPPSQSAQLQSHDNSGYSRSMIDGAWYWLFPTLEMQLDQCVMDQTTLNVGLHRENQLGDELLDIAETLFSELKLGNETLDKVKDNLMEAKGVIGDVLTGELDWWNLVEFVAQTFLKNATPEEHEIFIDNFFEDSIPDHVGNLASAAGEVVEGRNYLIALQGLGRDTMETLFPRTVQVAKLKVESMKYLMDILADDDIRVRYESYKEYGGNCEQASETWVKYRSAMTRKIQNILEEQGKASDKNAVDAYLKNLFAQWYKTEKEIYPVKKRELEDFKDLYIENHWLLQRRLENMPVGSKSECDRFLKVAEWANAARKDLILSMGACYPDPDPEWIRQAAWNMMMARVCGEGSMAQRMAEYQEIKLLFLKTWNCLAYQEPIYSDQEPIPSEPEETNGDVLIIGGNSGNFKGSHYYSNFRTNVISGGSHQSTLAMATIADSHDIDAAIRLNFADETITGTFSGTLECRYDHIHHQNYLDPWGCQGTYTGDIVNGTMESYENDAGQTHYRFRGDVNIHLHMKGWVTRSVGQQQVYGEGTEDKHFVGRIDGGTNTGRFRIGYYELIHGAIPYSLYLTWDELDPLFIEYIR